MLVCTTGITCFLLVNYMYINDQIWSIVEREREREGGREREMNFALPHQSKFVITCSEKLLHTRESFNDHKSILINSLLYILYSN